jgi:hypothetical protein
MNNAPGRNSAVPAGVLFDVPGELAVPVCARPGCGVPVPVGDSGRGRPRLYCSRSCKSKMARVKASATEEETGRAMQPAAGPKGARAVVLGYAALVATAARTFLEAVDGDPVAAYEEFCRQHLSLGAAAREAALVVRDEVRWPGLTEDERVLRRAEEESIDSGVMARVSPQLRTNTARAENAGAPAPVAQPAETARAENPDAARRSSGAAITARAEIRPAPAAPALTAPRLTLTRPTGWDTPLDRSLGDSDRSYALGGGLVHLTWPDYPGVQALERHGLPVGWIEEYDVEHGTWIALIDGSIVADAADGEMLLSANPADALTLLRLGLEQNLAR